VATAQLNSKPFPSRFQGQFKALNTQSINIWYRMSIYHTAQENTQFNKTH